MRMRGLTTTVMSIARCSCRFVKGSSSSRSAAPSAMTKSLWDPNIFLQVFALLIVTGYAYNCPPTSLFYSGLNLPVFIAKSLAGLMALKVGFPVAAAQMANNGLSRPRFRARRGHECFQEETIPGRASKRTALRSSSTGVKVHLL